MDDACYILHVSKRDKAFRKKIRPFPTMYTEPTPGIPQNITEQNSTPSNPRPSCIPQPSHCSLTMITHVINGRIHILSTSPNSPSIVDVHVHRHVEMGLAHVLTIAPHTLSVRLDPPLVQSLGHLPLLPVELYLELVLPVETRAHPEAYFVVLRRIGFVVPIGFPKAGITFLIHASKARLLGG